MSFSQKAFSGATYLFIFSIMSKAILLAGGIYLARLLTPEDFGLIAMLYIFFEISNFLIAGGLGVALIREIKISTADMSTAFYFNLLVSVTAYVVIWVSAPAISEFYGEQKLILLARIMGLNLIFGAFGLVQRAVYSRELKFKQLAIIGTISSLVTTLIAIILAYYGFGVIALAIKFTIGNLLDAIMLYVIMPWKSIGFINGNSFKKLFSFGSMEMALGLVNTISRNMHNVIIGKYYTHASLGFFNQGNMLKDNVTDTVNDAIMNVSFPILVKFQNEKERLKNAYIRIMKVSCYLIFPSITLLIASAEPLILFLFGEKWKGSILFLQILGCTGYVKHLCSLNLSVLKVYGKGRDHLTQGIIRNILLAMALLVATNISIIAIAWALVVVDFLQLFVSVYYSNKYLKFSLVEQLKIMLPTILLNLFTGIVLFSLSQCHIYSYLIKLLAMFTSLLFIYLSVSIVFKIEVSLEIRKLIVEKINSKLKLKWA